MKDLSRYSFAGICVVCASYLLMSDKGEYGWFIFMAIVAALA